MCGSRYTIAPDMKNHVAQRSLSLVNKLYFKALWVAFTNIFIQNVKIIWCDHNAIIINVLGIPLQWKQGMEVKYLGLSQVLEV